MKSHLWLQEPGEFPSAEATLCEKKLEMSFCWKMKMHIGHRPGPGPGLLGGTRLSGPAQGAGLPPALRRGVAAWPPACGRYHSRLPGGRGKRGATLCRRAAYRAHGDALRVRPRCLQRAALLAAGPGPVPRLGTLWAQSQGPTRVGGFGDSHGDLEIELEPVSTMSVDVSFSPRPHRLPCRRRSVPGPAPPSPGLAALLVTAGLPGATP